MQLRLPSREDDQNIDSIECDCFDSLYEDYGSFFLPNYSNLILYNTHTSSIFVVVNLTIS